MTKQTWTSAQINLVLKLHRKNIPRSEIAKLFNRKFDCSRTHDSIKHCIETYGSHIEQDIPKVLILDIETQALTVKTWGLFDQNIGLNQVLSDGGVLCWSAKWIGEKATFFSGTGGNPKKEKAIIKQIWKLMDEADIVLGQNSNRFDIKKLNAKFLEYELGSPSAYKKLDTLTISKRHFSFISHKLEYMTAKFCKIRKLIHSKFPGYSLWSEYEKGNKKALIEMEKYNETDILSTEELFVKLSEFDKTETTTDAMRAYHAARKAKK
jgi:uncharacterized protein YprB with RNaseH-like and TPR domain